MFSFNFKGMLLWDMGTIIDILSIKSDNVVT